MVPRPTHKAEFQFHPLGCGTTVLKYPFSCLWWYVQIDTFRGAQGGADVIGICVVVEWGHSWETNPDIEKGSPHSSTTYQSKIGLNQTRDTMM